jgi:hypothetical protein
MLAGHGQRYDHRTRQCLAKFRESRQTVHAGHALAFELSFEVDATMRVPALVTPTQPTAIGALLKAPCNCIAGFCAILNRADV